MNSLVFFLNTRYSGVTKGRNCPSALKSRNHNQIWLCVVHKRIWKDSTNLIPLGQLVEQIEDTAKKSKLFANWSGYTQFLMNSSTVGGTIPYSLQRFLSEDLLQSDLPKKYKVSALKNASALVWHQGAEQLIPLLPTNEMTRFIRLPWRALANANEKQECIETNSELVRLYCPTLHPLVKLATCDDDWCTKEKISPWVKKFWTTGPVDQLDIPDNALDP